ncbi:MAG: hypothetical protein KKA62_04170 [Nanoarchaeota archaeon]|nr:hypothetical protein [Nanoarchaeota archaeon]MBU1644529.1 hypothetical protein [Nanoarchaeota archaeon]MBU1977119.1 hypothetical protein [Nanoarchaeota archaeon]
MDIRKIRTCERCKNSVPLEKVRLYPKGLDNNLLICEDCCNKLKSSGTKPEQKKPVQNIPPNVVYLHCLRCKYSFKVDKNKADVLHKVLCPYCGKTDKIKEHVGYQETQKF